MEQRQQPTVVVVGGCPNCKSGVLNNEFGCCGWTLAILCFPIGILCCWAMKKKRCSHCAAVF